MMKSWLVGIAAVLLGGCASSGYRYHDSGYWSADRAIHGSVSYSIGTGYGSGFCAPWYGPFSYGPLWQSGYGCGPGFALGGFYGYGHLGWYDPYWRYYQYWRQPQGWQTRDPNAADQARRLSQQLDNTIPDGNNRYESLGPMRARSLGPGGGGGSGMPMRSYGSSRAPSAYPGYSGGLSGGRSGNAGLSGATRSSSGMGASRGMSSNVDRAPRSAPMSRSEIAPSRIRDSEE